MIVQVGRVMAAMGGVMDHHPGCGVFRCVGRASTRMNVRDVGRASASCRSILKRSGGACRFGSVDVVISGLVLAVGRLGV